MANSKDTTWEHWDSVTVLRKNINQQKKNGLSTSTIINPNATVEKKTVNHEIGSKLAKLDKADEPDEIKTITLSMGQKIQQARLAKGMKQKDLSNKINVKPQVIAEYENGKAIPDNKIIGKIERALGIKLLGKKQ